jgi:ring-1,2-phenylacetyl-CoA epoxidase subunit PaaD
MVNTAEQIWTLLEQVPDPEVPVLSVVDLGVVRDVQLSEEGATIVITPTYSGCPAMDMIAMNIRLALIEAGITQISIQHRLSPAWTTDWMSESGKQKLKEYGIAPPVKPSRPDGLFTEREEVHCPRCESANTELVSQFGSTSCKALYRCLDCKEPFDYFKCHR